MTIRFSLINYVLVCVMLSSCGGGGGGGGDGSGGGGTPAPSGLRYPEPLNFVVGQPISSISPTVTGTVSAYSVSPALPQGLSLSASTGVISGTPTAVTGSASYTVEARNSGGSATVSIILTVDDSPPVISYGGASFAVTLQAPLHLKPTNSGGSVVTWSITPALPTSLTFSTTDGSISGTPTTPAAAVTYVVTARNSGGQSTVSLTLAVQSVLLNLGQGGDVTRIRLGNSRVLGEGDDSMWALWDSGTAALIATGTTTCLHGSGSHINPCALPKVDIAGSIFVIEKSGGLEIRSATDGSLIATLTDPSLTWWQLATDGSYLCAGGSNGLTVWSPAGSVVTTRKADYASAIAFAAPIGVRVALGPAGISAIETISLPSGSSSVGPVFQGQFNSWFQDGGQFLTNVGNTIWVYSADGTQQDIRALPSISYLTGQGSWFWIVSGGMVTVYKVGSSASPAAAFSVGSVSTFIPSGTTIGVLEEHLGGSPLTVTGVVHIIDLSGATPVMADYAAPKYNNTAFAAISSSQWLLGSADGTILDGSSLAGVLRYFGYGSVLSIAGGGQRVAVATAVGKILYFNVATGALEGGIDSLGSLLALSADGSVLAAQDTLDAGALLQVYSVPSGTLTNSWPNSMSFSLSESGTVLAAQSQVVPAAGGALIWSGSTNGNPIRLSPDGTLIAVSTAQDVTGTTNIYLNGALVTAVPGWAVGWLDNGHLLIQIYSGGVGYVSSVIVGPTGVALSTPAPHEFKDPIQIVGPDSIYALNQNEIFSVLTGAPTWSTPTPATVIGAVAGSHVVFVSGNQVLSQPF